jgi:hypothetical protein
MAKEKKQRKFKVGVNLAPLAEGDPERRYEAGDEVPELTKAEEKALKDAIGEEGE